MSFPKKISEANETILANQPLCNFGKCAPINPLLVSPAPDGHVPQHLWRIPLNHAAARFAKGNLPKAHSARRPFQLDSNRGKYFGQSKTK